ncbi:NfeD family protein [Zavarzinia aquatilis]|uniref:NfeD family protein n=1 Tax=Zavarzinia aquatilis TaxID=2211142 RepID=A0A317EDR2_9PROT|nr:NfeD family protein [Zavarzinia aquatilis]PWR24891.1 NfeD family protein [Zavarzinia aquatilis]
MPDAMPEVVFWYWYALAGVLLILEILAPGVLFLWLAIGGFVAGTLLLLLPGVDLVYQVLVFAIASALSLLAGQKWLRRRPPEALPGLNQRADALVGTEAVLAEAIENGQGRAHLGGSSWRVTGADLPAGTKVRVVAANGTSLKVERV